MSLRVREVDETEAVCRGDGRGPVRHSQLGEDPDEMCLDGGFADEEGATDLGIGQPAADKDKDLKLARGEFEPCGSLLARGEARRDELRSPDLGSAQCQGDGAA